MPSDSCSLYFSNRSLASGPGGWLCGLILSLGLLAPPSLGAQPSFRFAAQGLDVDGLTPGGDAVLFGVVRERVPWMERVVPYAVWMTDDDGDGVASLATTGELGPKSVWAIVDLASPEPVVDGPDRDGFSVASAPPGHAFSAAATELRFIGSRLQVLLARAGSGAWTRVVTDGAVADRDGIDNGEVVLSLADLEPLAASGKPPVALRAGDVVVGVDTATLRISAETVAAQ